MATRYRTIFLSDLRLGLAAAHAEAEQWVLAGDVAGEWALARSWTQAHNDVIQKLLREVRKGAEMVYVPGNHDGAARQFAGLTFGGILVQRERVHAPAAWGPGQKVRAPSLCDALVSVGRGRRLRGSEAAPYRILVMTKASSKASPATRTT